jgi:hypothetical protein
MLEATQTVSLKLVKMVEQPSDRPGVRVITIDLSTEDQAALTTDAVEIGELKHLVDVSNRAKVAVPA